MRLEHIAFNMPDAKAAVSWYVEHLEMKVLVRNDDAPFIHFLCDAEERSTIEFYSNPDGPIPNYADMHPLTLHLAFLADDIEGTIARLVAAGGTLAQAPYMLGTNKLAIVRDPWGLSIQLVKRETPLPIL